MSDVPLTAKFHLLSYEEVQLERLTDPDNLSQSVMQTVIVTSPTAKVQLLDIYPTGGDDGGYTARVAVIEPAIRTDEGVIVPAGELLELKAQHEAAAKAADDVPQLELPGGGDNA